MRWRNGLPRAYGPRNDGGRDEGAGKEELVGMHKIGGNFSYNIENIQKPIDFIDYGSIIYSKLCGRRCDSSRSDRQNPHTTESKSIK